MDTPGGSWKLEWPAGWVRARGKGFRESGTLRATFSEDLLCTYCVPDVLIAGNSALIKIDIVLGVMEVEEINPGTDGCMKGTISYLGGMTQCRDREKYCVFSLLHPLGFHLPSYWPSPSYEAGSKGSWEV